jgi:protein-tyrosine phosphatase
MIEPMRYSALFGILGVVLAISAVQLAAGGAAGAVWALVAAEAYLAVGLLALAVAYGLSHRGFPIEEAFQHPGWMRVWDLLLPPYRILARMGCLVLRRFDSMDPMHAVGTRLYVGRIPVRSERAKLEALGVTSVLNLCVEFPRRPGRRAATGLETAYLPVLDGAAPSPGQFRAAVEWIAARHGEGRSILVHCAQGRGRSVTVAAAALCRLGLAAGPDEALAQITAARPRAKPSRRQRIALSRFLNSDQPLGANPMPAGTL